MAVVGQVLTAPEAGWKRIDDNHASIIKVGYTINNPHASSYGGSYSFTPAADKPIEFDFTGDRIRIIVMRWSTTLYYTGTAELVIDGKVMSQFSIHGATQYQTLIAEVTGLVSGKHTATIRVKAGGTRGINLDAVDIAEDGEILLPGKRIGDVLTQPEEGWKRYDDTHPAIKYGGAWTYASDGYGTPPLTDRHIGTNFNQKALFHFIGTSLRFIALDWITSSPNQYLKIDGVNHSFSSQNAYGGNRKSVLLFEVTGLDNTIHTVEYGKSVDDSAFLMMDVIDINKEGRLLHPDEVLEVSDLVEGKRIRCHYQASTNKVGVFSGYGLETSEFIPPTSTATPDGDFYLICVDEINGDKKLIADRNIQHSISWDELNNSGVTTGIEIGSGTDRTFKMYLVNGVTPAEGSILSTKVSVKKPYRINSIRIKMP